MPAIRTTAPLLGALLLTAALGACKNKDNYSNGTDTTAAAAVAAVAPAPAADAAITPTPTKWSSPAIIGFAETANRGEIELGKLGQKKAMNAAVKAFAKEMVTDHTMMLSETKKLGTKLNAMADTSVEYVTDLMGHTRDELKDLTEKAAGADWDKNYMDKMIEDHQKVLDRLQDAAKNTTDAEITKAIEGAVGKVQQHLTKAQDIKAKLQ